MGQGVRILFFLIMFFIVISIENPLVIGITFFIFLFTNLILNHFILGNRILFKGYFFMGFMIFLINPLISREGTTLIWKFITLEALMYGLFMGLKLIIIFFSFNIFSFLNDSDENFSFFSKYFIKLTLIFSVGKNIRGNLTHEIKRVKDVMTLRGVNFANKNIIKNIASYIPLLKIVLISQLDGAFERSECLFSRNFGKIKRSNYKKEKITVNDFLLLAIDFFLVFFFILELKMGKYEFDYYPQFKMPILSLDLIKQLNFIIFFLAFFIFGGKFDEFNRNE